jgi:hypothetical protein
MALGCSLKLAWQLTEEALDVVARWQGRVDGRQTGHVAVPVAAQRDAGTKEWPPTSHGLKGGRQIWGMTGPVAAS